jgi:hypothetical protein
MYCLLQAKPVWQMRKAASIELITHFQGMRMKQHTVL